MPTEIFQKIKQYILMLLGIIYIQAYLTRNVCKITTSQIRNSQSVCEMYLHINY